MPGLPCVGRVIETIQRYHTPSGQVRELRMRKVTMEDPPGIFKTYELVEVIPPLACSCIPQDMNDLAECSRCLSVVCASKHSQTCPECGMVYCTGCLATMEKNGEEVRVCKGCADEAKELPLLKALRKAIWG